MLALSQTTGYAILALNCIDSFTALVTLLLALLSIVFDLGHMGRAWHVFAYPNCGRPPEGEDA